MLNLLASHRCFDGKISFWEHDSVSCQAPMRFSTFVPPQATTKPVPVLYYLAGLTCNEETFMIKAGAQRFASHLGIMLVSPDTSPRNTGIKGEDEDWEFGSGAGFYLDATIDPWSKNYQMYSYITQELPAIVGESFPANLELQSIFGHSMGGHGALVAALKNPSQYRSVSAFSPIAAPSECPWGKKAFSGYLGTDTKTWETWDATNLLKYAGGAYKEILIDQGLEDEFLEKQLGLERFKKTCDSLGQKLNLRYHEGYDHGYNFVTTFISDHIAFHSTYLKTNTSD